MKDIETQQDQIRYPSQFNTGKAKKSCLRIMRTIPKKVNLRAQQKINGTQFWHELYFF